MHCPAFLLQQNLTINIEVDVLTENTMKQSLDNILDYKCIVAGGTRVFLLSLGVFILFPLILELGRML